MLLLNPDSKIAEALFKTWKWKCSQERRKIMGEVIQCMFLIYLRITLMSRRVPVAKAFHICWVVRVTLELRATILMVKGASVLSRMIALGVLWRVSSPYSTQCLIFYEKPAVRKYFLSTSGWFVWQNMWFFSFSSFVLFLKPTLCL